MVTCTVCMMPARHIKSFSYYYFNYFWHVAMLQKFACPLVGPLFVGPFSAEHAEHAYKSTSAAVREIKSSAKD